LNKEQATIVKDILTKKKKAPNEPIHLFLIGGMQGLGKHLIGKAIFQSLVCMYNNRKKYDPLKLKGIITIYI
jgi:hypothetical protein